MINSIKLVYLQNYFTTFNRPPYVVQVRWARTPGAWRSRSTLPSTSSCPCCWWSRPDWWRVTLPAAAFVLLVGLPGPAAGRPPTSPWIGRGIMHATHVRIDSLFFGAFLAFPSQPAPGGDPLGGPHAAASSAVVGLLLILPMCVFALGTPIRQDVRLTRCWSLGVRAVLLAGVRDDRASARVSLGRLLASRVADAPAWVGVWSYSIYLWHFEILAILVELPVLPLAAHRRPSRRGRRRGRVHRRSDPAAGRLGRDLYLATCRAAWRVFMVVADRTADARVARSALPLPDAHGHRDRLARRISGSRRPVPGSVRAAPSRRTGRGRTRNARRGVRPDAVTWAIGRPGVPFRRAPTPRRPPRPAGDLRAGEFEDRRVIPFGRDRLFRGPAGIRADARPSSGSVGGESQIKSNRRRGV